MKTCASLGAAVGLAVAAVTSLSAHHGTAAYDLDHATELVAMVTGFK